MSTATVHTNTNMKIIFATLVMTAATSTTGISALETKTMITKHGGEGGALRGVISNSNHLV